VILKKIQRSLSSSALVVLGFVGAIVVGTSLLCLPCATATGSISPVDALFTATSATCVTGLIVLDTGKDFTLFGQCVILLLIQAGGLGIMTVSTFFLLLLGRRVSMRDQMALRDSLGQDTTFTMRRLVLSVMFVTALMEAVGWVSLFFAFTRTGIPVKEAAYSALFHSVSAFCNAGFSLYSDSLSGFLDTPWVIGTVLGLFVVGGLGFVVLLNLSEHRPWRRDWTKKGRLSLQTKVVCSVSAALGILGLVLFLAFEWNHTLSELSLQEKLWGSFFHSLTPRTAGFNVLRVSDMRHATLFLTLALMFVGASPGSTGGGIKTCTLAVVLGLCRSLVLKREEVVLFGRSVPQDTIYQAIGIVVISVFLVFFLTLALLVSDGNSASMSLEQLFFESVSAFGTVGLSTGVTPHLSCAGKLILVLTMFIGRISPLTLALVVSRVDTGQQAIRHPEQPIMVG